MLLFQSGNNSGCYGSLKLPFTYNGKSENWHLLLSNGRYFDKSFTEKFLE